MTIPGTYDYGDRVTRTADHMGGTVEHDNRRIGGQYVWVKWDDEAPVVACSDPAEFRSTS